MKLFSLHSLLNKDDSKQTSQYVAVITATITIFISGIHGGWPSPSLEKVMSSEYPFHVSEDEASYIAIAGPAGDIIGGLVGANLVDFLGRKMSILLLAGPHLLVQILFYFSYYGKYYLYLARVLGGIAEGATLIIIPQYIAEVAQPKIRGILGTMNSIMYLGGCLYINIIGSFLDIHTVALISCIFPFLFLILFNSMPETPYYLLMKNQSDKARASLQFLRRSKNVEKELGDLTADVRRQMSESGTYNDLFRIDSNRKALLLVVTTRIFQQFSGSTAFSMYIQILLKEATDISPVIGSSFVILTRLLTFICCSFFVDRFGRKSLLTASCGTCFLVLLAQAIFFTLRDYTSVDMSALAWFPLLVMVLFNICFGFGLGVGANIITSEYFSTSIKPKALSICSVVFAGGMLLSTKFYQVTADNLGLAVPFYSFSFISFIGSLFFLFVLPETRGKTLECIQQQFKGNVKTVKKVSLSD